MELRRSLEKEMLGGYKKYIYEVERKPVNFLHV